MYEGKEQLFDTGCLFDKTVQGGKVGLFVFSQKLVMWSDLQVKCEGKVYHLVKSFILRGTDAFRVSLINSHLHALLRVSLINLHLHALL